MLSDVFYWVFNMSVSAAIAGSVVLLLAKIKRIPRWLICALMLIPFLRMWLPFGMGNEYSLMSLISKFTTKTVIVYEGRIPFSITNFTMAANSYFPIIYKTSILESVFRIASVIWIIIAAALLIAMFIIYNITKAELKDARLLRNNIYISDKITSPSVYGIFREKIILPSGYDENDLKFILMHENAHIRRKDNLWRILAVATACIHWFNPLAWLFLKSFFTNSELACDEAVLKKCSENEKKAYATMLINCAESKNLYVSAFGGAKLRVRIERIISYKKLSALSITAFVMLAAAVSYTLLTNAM